MAQAQTVSTCSCCQCHRSAHFQLTSPLCTEPLRLLRRTRAPRALLAGWGRRLPEQRNSRCQENGGTGQPPAPGDPLVPLDRQSVGTFPSEMFIPQKPSILHQRTARCTALGAGLWVTRGVPAVPAPLLAGTDPCCVPQQHNGGRFGCPSICPSPQGRGMSVQTDPGGTPLGYGGH